MLGQTVEQPRPHDLRSQYRREAFPRLVQQDAIIKDARCVNDPDERGRAMSQIVQQACQRGLIGDIKGFDPHRHAPAHQVSERHPLAFFLHAAPPGQHEVSRPLRRQPVGHRQT